MMWSMPLILTVVSVVLLFVNPQLSRCANNDEGDNVGASINNGLALDLEMAEHLASLPFDCYAKVSITNSAMI